MIETDNQVLEKNLEAIAKKSPKIAQDIRDYTPFKDIDFVISKSNDIVMCYKKVPLHDTEDPILEAKMTYDNVTHKGHNAINVVFGLGLGYLFKRATIELKGIIILFEPHLDVLRATLEIVDFSNELSREKVFLVKSMDELNDVFFTRYLQGDNAGIQMLTTYRLEYPDILEELVKVLNEVQTSCMYNQITILCKSRDWSLAAIRNIFDIAKSPNMLLLEDKLKDIPTVIVSAGPSLDYTLESLKKVQDKVFIVCVGQALKALDKAGIKPHIVCVIENLNVSQQFEGVSYINDLNIMVEPMTHRSIFELPVKRTIMFYPLGDFIARWFGRGLQRDVRGYPNKGTVSICAYYLARNAGSNPIMLIGQDLAFRDGNRYAKNSSYDLLKYEMDNDGKLKFTYNDEAYEKIGKTFGLTKEEFEEKNRREATEQATTKGWDGETIYTTGYYKLFINYFSEIAEHEMKKMDRRFINCSYGGAYIEHMEHMKFEDVLKECNLDHGIDINQTLEEVLESFKVEQDENIKVYKLLRKTEKELNESIQLSRLSIELAEKIQKELQKHNFNGNYIDSILVKLSKNDHKLTKLVAENELINPFIQAELFEYTSNYARKENDDSINVVEDLKENIEQSLKLYKAIIKGSEDINNLLSEVFKENNELIKNYV